MARNDSPKSAPAGPTLVEIIGVELQYPNSRAALAVAFRDEFGTLLDRTYLIGTLPDPTALLVETWFCAGMESDARDLVDLADATCGFANAVVGWNNIVGGTVRVDVQNGVIGHLVQEDPA